MNTSDPAPVPPAAPPAVPHDPLVALLRAQAVASVGGGVLLLFAGVFGGLLLLWLLTAVLWLIAGTPGLGFTGWFVLFVVLYAVGAVAWLRQRPAALAGVPFAYIDPRQEWSGTGEYRGSLALFGPPLDVLFIPARMAVAGVEQGRGREPASRERFFDRCALLLRQLGRRGEAMPTTAVTIGDAEPPAKLDPVLGYLDRAEWVGLSSDRSRLWLSGRAKDELFRMGIVPDQPK